MAAGLGSVSLAGCSQVVPGGTGGPTAVEALAFDATMASQPSEDSPARVRVSVTNEREALVTIVYGAALLFTDTGPDEPATAWPNVVDLGRGDEWHQQRGGGGCWVGPEDGPEGVMSIRQYEQLPGGETYSEEYFLLTDPAAGTCLPPGTYVFEEVGGVRPGEQDEGDGTTFLFRVVVNIIEDQPVEASGTVLIPGSTTG